MVSDKESRERSLSPYSKRKLKYHSSPNRHERRHRHEDRTYHGEKKNYGRDDRSYDRHREKGRSEDEDNDRYDHRRRRRRFDDNDKKIAGGPERLPGESYME